MVEIILARHGETDWNTAELFRGTIDVELNETGVRQAELLGAYLKEVEIDAVYSSPLKRALKTAELIVGSRAMDVNIAHGLIDFDFGEWQGLSHQAVKDRYSKLYQEWINNPEHVGIPGGETLKNVKRRAMSVVNDVLRRYNNGIVVMVSHRVVNKVLVCALLGLENSHFWNIRVDTCGITRFDYETGKFILTGHNDISFLEPVQNAPLDDF
ncbi:histidine phosphatase family protein [Chloroflexota bacterium]